MVSPLIPILPCFTAEDAKSTLPTGLKERSGVGLAAHVLCHIGTRPDDSPGCNQVGKGKNSKDVAEKRAGTPVQSSRYEFRKRYCDIRLC